MTIYRSAAVNNHVIYIQTYNPFNWKPALHILVNCGWFEHDIFIKSVGRKCTEFLYLKMLIYLKIQLGYD